MATTAKKRLSVAIATMISASALAGCGGGTGNTTSLGPIPIIAGAPVPAALVLSTAQKSPTRVHMDWSGGSSGTRYDIYRDGTPDGSTQANVSADTGLAPGTNYCYQVTEARGSSNKSCATTAPLAGWDIEKVNLAPPLALALDAQGLERRALCSGSGVAYEAQQPDGSWQLMLVDPAARCAYASIGLGGDGSVHILYADTVSNAVKYATNVAGSWSVSTVPETAGALFPAAVVDASNHVHLTYLNYTGHAGAMYQIIYATDAGGSWQSTVVIDDFGYPAIAVDAQGQPAIAYVSIGGSGAYPVHYLQEQAGSWNDLKVAVSGDPKSLVALAMDASGDPHLVYKDQAGLYVGDGVNWQVTQIDSFDTTGSYADSYGAYDVSIAVDVNGGVHLSYEDTDENLKYASQSGSGWTEVYVDTQGAQNQLKVDPAGHAHIAYVGSERLYSLVALSP